MIKNDVIQNALTAHAARFGKKPEAAAWAPGRIEVLGNHTDYNEGTTLSAAIDLGHCFCISRSARTGICVLAVDVGQDVCVELSNTERVAGASWANYIKGVFFLLQKKLGRRLGGLDCTFLGSIPMGTGLSSSAALEVSAATALLGILNETADQKEIAALCREAEHRFAGTHCGLLDQFSSLFGLEHGLIHSDFRTQVVSAVRLPDDIEFLVINPNVKHSHSDSPYNERRKHCEQAARELAALLPRPVTALRDVSPDEFALLKAQLHPAAAKRAAHVIGEISRVETGVELLKTGAVEAFGELLFESHQSSIDFFENSCPELDEIVAAAREAGALGARLSGGGFGGCAIVMVHSAQAGFTAQKIKNLCVQKMIKVDILEVVPSTGAHGIVCEPGAR